MQKKTLHGTLAFGWFSFLRNIIYPFLIVSRRTLGTRGSSAWFPDSSLQSDPREKLLDQSAIPLIAPSQLQTHLFPNIQNLDVLQIGSLEMSV